MLLLVRVDAREVRRAGALSGGVSSFLHRYSIWYALYGIYVYSNLHGIKLTPYTSA